MGGPCGHLEGNMPARRGRTWHVRPAVANRSRRRLLGALRSANSIAGPSTRCSRPACRHSASPLQATQAGPSTRCRRPFSRKTTSPYRLHDRVGSSDFRRMAGVAVFGSWIRTMCRCAAPSTWPKVGPRILQSGTREARASTASANQFLPPALAAGGHEMFKHGGEFLIAHRSEPERFRLDPHCLVA